MRPIPQETLHDRRPRRLPADMVLRLPVAVLVSAAGATRQMARHRVRARAGGARRPASPLGPALRVRRARQARVHLPARALSRRTARHSVQDAARASVRFDARAAARDRARFGRPGDPRDLPLHLARGARPVGARQFRRAVRARGHRARRRPAHVGRNARAVAPQHRRRDQPGRIRRADVLAEPPAVLGRGRAADGALLRAHAELARIERSQAHQHAAAGPRRIPPAAPHRGRAAREARA